MNLRRNALKTTVTEDNAIARLAITGLSNIWANGKNTPCCNWDSNYIISHSPK